MKITSRKPVEFKTLTIGVGISVGILVFSFLISFYGETKSKMQNRMKNKPAPVLHEPKYTEVRGMN